ncbi:MAG: choice-of-anchor Q domain-containing protein [Bacteroidota bacterium]
MKRPLFLRAALLLLGLLALNATSFGATRWVTTVVDDPGLAGSLRYEIGIANNGDDILFDPSLAGLQIFLTHGEILVNKHLDIYGPTGRTTLTTPDNFRMFHIDLPNPSYQVRIRDLNFKHGFAIDGGGAILMADWGTLHVNDCNFTDNIARSYTGSTQGGAIWARNSSAIHLTDCVFKNNRAETGVEEARGGAVATDNNNFLTVFDCVFEDNWTNTLASTPMHTSYGGAIAVLEAELMVQRSDFIGNEAQSSNGRSYGGAISCDATDVDLRGVGFRENKADATGGALDMRHEGQTAFIMWCEFTDNEALIGGGLCTSQIMRMENCTVGRNIASQTGGGIALLPFTVAPLSGGTGTFISACTIAENECTSGIGGGVIAVPFSPAPYTRLYHSIVSGNVHATHPNVRGDLESFGHNVLSDDGGPDFISLPSDLLNTNPLLGPLDFYGGPRRGYTLFPGSPAIDKSTFGSGLPFDVRGLGFVREYGGAQDAGSLEMQPIPGAKTSPSTDIETKTFTASVFPNPFHVQAHIRFSLPQADEVRVVLYNIAGEIVRELWNGSVNAQESVEIPVDGQDLTPGIYLFQVVSPKNGTQSGKMVHH